MNKIYIKQAPCMALFICFTALLITSCTSNQIKVDSDEAIDIKNGLVVRDFLVAISQVYDPATSTLQLNAPASRFGQEFENGFRELGYGMQRVTSDQGELFLSYTKTSSENSGNTATSKYKVSVGAVSFERTYAAVTGGGIAPSGPMVIYGTNKPVSLNEDLFPGQSVEVVYAKESEIVLDEGEITVIDASVMSAISALRQNDLPSYKSLNSQDQEIENLFNRGTSNFEAVEDVYRTVRMDTIIFDNDSLDLKPKGREQITKLMKFYEPETDVFRLIGCSIGPTKIDGGNELLALGRSERVAKELVDRQVQLESIFDEGCWSPTAGETDKVYPPRAVVVELQRKG